MLIHDSANLDHRFDQLLRCEDVAQAQGRVENLTHCAGVDDTTGVIEPLQTWEWGTGITKFRVVIVLENVSVARARKIDQSRPSRETHRHAERKLMGRRHVNYFWRALFRRSHDHDSLPVNRSGNHGRAGETKSTTGLVKPRIFDPRNFAPVYQGCRADHHRLLCAGCDHDLIRMTARAPIIA